MGAFGKLPLPMSLASDNAPPLSPLKRALLAIENLQAKLAAAERRQGEPIAVVGLGCRFPGDADTPADYWRLLSEGTDAVTEVPAARWLADAFFDADPSAVGRMNTRHGGFLRDIEGFDPGFFGLSPREVASMDPQHRLLLEVGWEALAAAGQLRDRLAGSLTGVFVGITTVEYGQLQLAAEGLGALDAYHITGNALNAAAGRLAYVFGLHGPCMAVDTACSSSLVAVHLACASLRAGECTAALAGGVNLILSPHGSIALSKGRVLSPTGRARTFDAAADGMVRGEGCGLLVLRRLADAQRDGDRILALIRGSGVNQDGPSSGLTVPNGPAQEALLRRVLAAARVAPEAVGYVEAHGTATALGDPIEVGALGAVYGAGRPPDHPLWIGSVKTNFGHLESAAGVAGLIKAILALHHEGIPPHLHFQAPSPHIPWDRWPFRVPTAFTPWPRGPRPRIAGVSAFGFSGTNAHILVEESPAPPLMGDARGLAAPAAPFQRERFPLPRAAVALWAGAGGPDSDHPLLGRRVALAGTAESRFEAVLSPAAPAFLGDHRVFGAAVLPAAAMIEMALAAARTLFGAAEAGVRDLEIRQALVFHAEVARRVQTVVAPAGEDAAEVRIFSAVASGGADGWILHATARATKGGAGPAAEDLAAVRARCGRELSAGQLYADYGARGLSYGPAFAAIRAIHGGVNEALAEIGLPEPISPLKFGLHPVLLDACFQAAGAACGEAPAGEVFLPVGAGGWRLREVAPLAAIWGHARAHRDGAEASVDLAIFNPDGVLVAQLEGLALRRASRESLRRSLGSPGDDCLYGVAWVPAAPPAPPSAAPPGAWLVAADPGGVGGALAARLAASGQRVTTAPAGASAEELTVLLAAGAEWRGVVHCGALDAAAAESACGRVLALTQALAADGRALPLWVVTRGAVPAADAVVRPPESSVWGFARVIMAEHPEWSCRLVDLDEGADAVERLFGEILQPDGENQVAWRGGQRLAARLERLALAAGPAVPVRAGGAYLVTGGLGALGLLTADWLVRRGARRLVLVGRAAPSPAARTRVAAWEAAGVTVTTASADVSDRGALATLLAGIAADGGILRGIVHAAGVLDDGVLRQQTLGRFARVLGAKANGAQHLDELTRGAPLDFFILFSSTAAVLGTPGQGNYAAANAFLDGLAQRRRSEGRPGLSVNWGPWAAGMAAGLGDRYSSRGVGAIEPGRGFEELDRLLSAGVAQAAVLPVAWEQFFRSFSGPVPPLFSTMKGSGPKMLNSSDELNILGPEPLDFLRVEVARVLRIAPERLGVNQALTALGLDSLMAVELRSRVRAAAGIDLPVVAFLEGASVRQLAEEMRRRLAAGRAAAAAPAVTAVPASSIWPLTAGQEALWFLHQTDPASPAYHTAFALRLRGALDAAALGRVFAALAARHPLLRASFPLENGVPTLVVAGQWAPAAAGIDASAWSEATLAARVAEEYARPFDLERGPLLRIALFRRGEGDHVLLCVIHHIVGDAWTNWLLIDEFRRLYAAAAMKGSGSNISNSSDEIKIFGADPLAPLEATYADFGRWQRELLAGAEGARLWEYWRRQLGGELPVLSLPTDHARPAVLAPRGAAVPLDLPPDLMGRLRELAQSRGATPFALLLAAWHVLLHRHTGQDDIIVGSPTAGRSQPEFAGVAGYFVNPVPIRANLSGRPAFAAFLETVRRTTLAAMAHADFPLPLLVDRLRLPRDPSRPALFQTLFVYQKSQNREAAAGMAGLAVEEFPLVQMAGQFELMLEIFDGAGASLKYNTALFTEDTAHRLARRFRTLLEGIAADPERRIDELPLLDTAERAAVVRSWNDTPADYPQELCLHELIAAQAARTPGAAAVTFAGTALTYGDLQARAHRLAHWLRRAGVGPDTLVGVCAERSPELVVALLGILAAGGAYVPLDPSYPRDRLAFMREDSGVSLVLTQAALAEGWAGAGVRVLRLDADWPEVAGEPATPPAPGVTPDHLAYLIYTSGSTGRPKGAGNTHRAIVNRLLWMQDAYRLTAHDRVVQKTPFSFDVSVWEFFWPLLAGARLVVARPGGHQDAAYLAGLVAREEVTTMHFVPSMLQAFVEEPGLADCRALRQVFCSGEALPHDLTERFFARHPAELHNLYGPTEAAVDVSSWRCEGGGARRIVPIGRPIARTQLYVLDRRGQPAPIGVPGELHLGGAGLARGYHGRPELTAEKFIPDPFGPPGARLYRTGDLARWLPDGVVEYLGRLDHQVKLRGFRIELGEIESALARQPGVREAVVVVREDRPGDPQLVAYVVPRGQAATVNTGAILREEAIAHVAGINSSGLTPSVLRRALREVLPDYMVPADFVLLPQLPLSPNGKVDRRALPAPSRARPALEADFVAPATETERRLAALWSEVLGRERVGVLDNFFDLGGHSLRLGQVHARLTALFQRPPALVELFQHPTIRALAARLDGASEAPAAGAGRAEARGERRGGQRDQRAKRQGARAGIREPKP